MSIKATLMLLNPLKPSDYILQFLTLKNYTFYPHYCICVFCMDPRTSHQYFPSQH